MLERAPGRAARPRPRTMSRRSSRSRSKPDHFKPPTPREERDEAWSDDNSDAAFVAAAASAPTAAAAAAASSAVATRRSSGAAEPEYECERGCGFDGTRAEVEAHEKTCYYDPRPFE